MPLGSLGVCTSTSVAVKTAATTLGRPSAAANGERAGVADVDAAGTGIASASPSPSPSACAFACATETVAATVGTAAARAVASAHAARVCSAGRWPGVLALASGSASGSAPRPLLQMCGAGALLGRCNGGARSARRAAIHSAGGGGVGG